MKNLGFILLCAGFLGGAYVTALDVENVSWTPFVIAAAIAVIGLVISKQQASAHARSSEVLELNRSALRDALQNIVRDLGEIIADSSHNGARLRDRIDQTLRADLRRFADARESMVHLFGLQSYADIMSSFAAGERYINRVWSASADGYDEEAATYLQKAAAQFADAQQQLQQAAEATA